MRLFRTSRLIVALGAAIVMVGCTGEPRTYYAAKSIVLHRHATAQAQTRSVPTASVLALSTDEKERLFRGFQASLGLKGQPITTQHATP